MCRQPLPKPNSSGSMISTTTTTCTKRLQRSKRPLTPYLLITFTCLFALSSQVRFIFSSMILHGSSTSGIAFDDDHRGAAEVPTDPSFFNKNKSKGSFFNNNNNNDDDSVNNDNANSLDSTTFPMPDYNDLSNVSGFAEFWNASHYWKINAKPLGGSTGLMPVASEEPPRMLVGIFTRASMRERRQAIRETSLNFHNDMMGYNGEDWSKYHKVCSLWEIQTQKMKFEDCLLTYVFVASGGDEDAPTILVESNRNTTSSMLVPGSEDDDMILLNIRENMNEGKTPTWFYYASKTLALEGLVFDYIAKMDDDTLLFTGNWMDILERRLPKPHLAHPQGLVYGGKSNQVLHVWKDRCEAPGANFTTCPLLGPLWMIGPFYFLSRELALYTTSQAIDQVALQSDEDVATATYVFSHPSKPKIFDIQPKASLQTYNLAWDWAFHNDQSRFQGVIFAHSENACYMPYGPYYKRLANVRKVWREYITFRWKQRLIFHDRYRLDDHPAHDNKKEKHDSRKVTVLSSDYIYSNDDFDASPIVLESPYNLVFFPVTGAGDVVWRCIIRRILGYEDWADTSRQFDGLTYLSNYTLEQASEIMSSPNYTRAIFVRNPLDRIQSNYIQMVEHDGPHHEMISGCDCARGCGQGENILERCKNDTSTFRDFLTGLVNNCDKPYWRPQAYRMEPKYVEALDYIGRYESFDFHTTKLLRRIWKGALGWTYPSSIAKMLKTLNKSYSADDYSERFEAAWQGPFLHEYRSEKRSPLVSKYKLDIDRLKAKAFYRKKRQIQWIGDKLEEIA